MKAALQDVADTYVRAFETLRREGMAEKHLALLQEHWKARHHTITWEELARKVGYPTGSAVNLQYGILSGRIGRLLGMTEPPHPPDSADAAWILVLVSFARKKGAKGHQAYVLRKAVIEALARTGIVPVSEPQPGVPADGARATRDPRR